MKRYKYQALVALLPQNDGGPESPLPGPTCRMVVRACHRETHQSKIFSALVSTSDDLIPESSHIIATVTVLGDDARDYLAAGDDFTLWCGHDVGHGVVTRRVFV